MKEGRGFFYQCWFMNSFWVMVNVHSLLHWESSSYDTAERNQLGFFLIINRYAISSPLHPGSLY